MNKKEDFFSFINTPKGKMFLNVMESNGNKLNTIHAHLIFEELLTEYLLKIFPLNNGIENAKLQFHQKLTLIYSLRNNQLSNQLYGMLKKLNKIRNKYAHSLDPSDVESLENELILSVPKIMFPEKTLSLIGNKKVPLPYTYSEKYVIALRWIFSELIIIRVDQAHS
ncbi:hypothetical protein [Aeromonas hydrophila]|uniref:hypothetical protein n=1 Tax=Aeromonas hydrophila TaxID=644 RepID=UPI00107FBF3E|nr:hypothetical protein [Aeromonas hydrophila]QPR87296.1 hypothetical protein I6G73_17770 [Aeromonas hydrophila]UON52401.1 hypothetical protein IUJ49_16920 [Aeromonas hydrophila]